MTPEDTFVVTSAGGMMPNQAEGFYRNIGWCFRARHGVWQLWRLRDGKPVEPPMASGTSDCAGGWSEPEEYLPFVEALVRCCLC